MQPSFAVIALQGLLDAARFGRSEDGQDLLEYGLLAALIALLALGAVTTVGATIQTVFWDVIANGMGANA